MPLKESVKKKKTIVEPITTTNNNLQFAGLLGNAEKKMSQIVSKVGGGKKTTCENYLNFT